MKFNDEVKITCSGGEIIRGFVEDIAEDSFNHIYNIETEGACYCLKQEKYHPDFFFIELGVHSVEVIDASRD